MAQERPEKISELPTVTILAPTDFFPVVASGVTSKILSSNLVATAAGAFGTPLTDADQTLTAAQGANRRQPAASLTANRVKTLQAPTADGQAITIWRDDASGFTLTIVNGGYWGGQTTVAAGTKVTFTSGGGEWAVSNVEAI